MTGTFTPLDHRMMRRAVQLARNGALHASPNPMVGAVICTPDGRIAGEGWHRRCGEGHAEVNAVASVADRSVLAHSTMYVTLEPCSHYGKTPPCAQLIIDSGIPRVVVATLDPFEKVSGRGVEMLRNAGVDVSVGLLGAEARRLNRRFMTAHTLHRPFITLKWACSADGFIDGRHSAADPAACLSTPLTRVAVHRLRAMHDAILVGSGTFLSDGPSLTVRCFAGDSPVRLLLDRRGCCGTPEGWSVCGDASLRQLVERLYRDGITSLLVEGGRRVLEAFLADGLWDEIRVETNPHKCLADMPLTVEAPKAPAATYAGVLDCNIITDTYNNHTYIS